MERNQEEWEKLPMGLEGKSGGLKAKWATGEAWFWRLLNPFLKSLGAQDSKKVDHMTAQNPPTPQMTFFFFWSFSISWATPMAYGGSQAGG